MEVAELLTWDLGGAVGLYLQNLLWYWSPMRAFSVVIFFVGLSMAG
jgi:hypothetical protein